MRRALALAADAAGRGEVPVGAVVADPDGNVIGEGSNETLRAGEVSAHAEIVALREASRRLGNHLLPGCSIYVTLEPCSMCAGAVIWARLSRLVFGAHDEKFGACGSRVDLFAPEAGLNHHATVTGGVLREDSVGLLREFFRARR